MTIKLDICCGTACYLLGAGKLMEMENDLPQNWRSKVEIRIFPCLNLCESEDLEGAPFVRIDEEIIAKATLEKIMNRIRNKLENEEKGKGADHD
ncbi:MAG: hypothetical protein Q4G69_06930 [Planctomycetia bacterium]|nr:hypothetical protein [Planctomycetia bacterium]